ncbi:fam-c protein [Diplonema papillatum]|nr:fam-c protein [Diplonema papillatum]
MAQAHYAAVDDAVCEEAAQRQAAAAEQRWEDSRLFAEAPVEAAGAGLANTQARFLRAMRDLITSDAVKQAKTGFADIFERSAVGIIRSPVTQSLDAALAGPASFSLDAFCPNATANGSGQPLFAYDPEPERSGCFGAWAVSEQSDDDERERRFDFHEATFNNASFEETTPCGLSPGGGGGRGFGDSLRQGKGFGDSQRQGKGFGDSLRQGKGFGDSQRQGKGVGDSQRQGKGFGDSLRQGRDAGGYADNSFRQAAASGSRFGGGLREDPRLGGGGGVESSLFGDSLQQGRGAGAAGKHGAGREAGGSADKSFRQAAASGSKFEVGWSKAARTSGGRPEASLGKYDAHASRGGLEASFCSDARISGSWFEVSWSKDARTSGSRPEASLGKGRDARASGSQLFETSLSNDTRIETGWRKDACTSSSRPALSLSKGARTSGSNSSRVPRPECNSLAPDLRDCSSFAAAGCDAAAPKEHSVDASAFRRVWKATGGGGVGAVSWRDGLDSAQRESLEGAGDKTGRRRKASAGSTVLEIARKETLESIRNNALALENAGNRALESTGNLVLETTKNEALEGMRNEALERTGDKTGRRHKASAGGTVLEIARKETLESIGNNALALESAGNRALESTGHPVLDTTKNKALESMRNEAIASTENRALEGTGNKALEGTGNKALEGTGNKALEGTGNKALEGTGNNALESIRSKALAHESVGSRTLESTGNSAFECTKNKALESMGNERVASTGTAAFETSGNGAFERSGNEALKSAGLCSTSSFEDSGYLEDTHQSSLPALSNVAKRQFELVPTFEHTERTTLWSTSSSEGGGYMEDTHQGSRPASSSIPKRQHEDPTFEHAERVTLRSTSSFEDSGYIGDTNQGPLTASSNTPKSQFEAGPTFEHAARTTLRSTSSFEGGKYVEDSNQGSSRIPKRQHEAAPTFEQTTLCSTSSFEDSVVMEDTNQGPLPASSRIPKRQHEAAPTSTLCSTSSFEDSMVMEGTNQAPLPAFLKRQHERTALCSTTSFEDSMVMEGTNQGPLPASSRIPTRQHEVAFTFERTALCSTSSFEDSMVVEGTSQAPLPEFLKRQHEAAPAFEHAEGATLCSNTSSEAAAPSVNSPLVAYIHPRDVPVHEVEEALTVLAAIDHTDALVHSFAAPFVPPIPEIPPGRSRDGKVLRLYAQEMKAMRADLGARTSLFLQAAQGIEECVTAALPAARSALKRCCARAETRKARLDRRKDAMGAKRDKFAARQAREKTRIAAEEAALRGQVGDIARRMAGRHRALLEDLQAAARVAAGVHSCRTAGRAADLAAARVDRLLDAKRAEADVASLACGAAGQISAASLAFVNSLHHQASLRLSRSPLVTALETLQEACVELALKQWHALAPYQSSKPIARYRDSIPSWVAAMGCISAGADPETAWKEFLDSF